MQFDLIVIGSGAAGQKAALQAAKAGKKVAVIEKDALLGGGCVHSGTLPSKSFRESIYRWSLGSQGTLGKRLDAAGSPQALAAATAKPSLFPDIARLLKRVDRVTRGEAEVVAAQFKRNGVQVFQGRARFEASGDGALRRVTVEGNAGTQSLAANKVIIAVGSGPAPLTHLPVDGVTVFDSNNVLRLKRLPRSLVVLGGGVIGCEYASMFATAGTKVYLVDKRHEILASVDREIVQQLTERFSWHGMELILETEATRIEELPKDMTERVRVQLASGRAIDAEAVLVALGRHGNTRGLGLENVGIDVDERFLIPVDANYRTKAENIYAVGDVIGPPALASTGMEQGRIACCHAFNIKSETTTLALPPYFPYGIYTIPEISTVGETEESLKESGVDFVSGIARYKELARGQIVGDQWGLLKLVVERKTLRLLGVHIIGDNAADIVHVGQAVMAFEGQVDYFIRNVFNYPTFAEAYKTAAFHAINQRALKK